MSAGRFALNTTLGMGGLLDPATDAGIPRERESFRETLGVWGAGSGPYLVLPLLGPSSIRDLVPRAGSAASPREDAWGGGLIRGAGLCGFL